MLKKLSKAGYISKRLNQPHVYGTSTYFNAFLLLKHLRNFDEIWATTFTFDPVYVKELNLSKVVYAKLSPNATLNKKFEARQCANIHAKLFICFMNKKIHSVFIGSWNLVAPTYLEIITTVPSWEHENVKLYFNTIWNQL